MNSTNSENTWGGVLPTVLSAYLGANVHQVHFFSGSDPDWPALGTLVGVPQARLDSSA